MIAIALGLMSLSMAMAKTEGRYASIIIDTQSLEILHARQIDAARYPASLTKIMTLHLAFAAIDRGDISLSDEVRISNYAASTPPVGIGLRQGQSMTIDALIQAVSVRSANDAAVALAEAVAGSEGLFVARMNALAKDLGMHRTHFRNPHGLPDENQLTTARDMAKLAQATLARFPHHYHYFGQTHFRGKANTNKLLRTRADVDGFKTGFTRASGYNLVISAQQNGDRIIAIVLGGASSGSRFEHMSDLIDRGFAVMNAPPAPVMTAVSYADTSPDRSWALQIDGFESRAEAEILADRLIRTAGMGEIRSRSGTFDGRTLHSIRIEALNHGAARQLCADHADLLNIPSRRCKVLSVVHSG